MSAKPDHFTFEEGFASWRPIGTVSLDQANQMLVQILNYALEQKVTHLLVDTTGLVFPIPTLADRYFLVQEWAQIIRGRLKLAFVHPPEIIDPQKFGATAARNSGLVMNSFTSETDALEWLKGR